MSRTRTPKAGCFSVTFPSTVWISTKCVTPPNVPLLPKFAPSTVGDGNDYSAQSGTGASPSTLIGSSVGSFQSISGLTSESDNQQSPGTNYYSLQINPNPFLTSTTYTGGNLATGFEQFVFLNDPGASPSPSGFIYIEYWLFDYLNTHSSCPTTGPPPTDSWMTSGASCYANTYADNSPPPVPFEQASNLGNLILKAFVNYGTSCSGPCDETAFCISESCYAMAISDTVLNLYQYWYDSEFNVFGFCCGSQANFNSGTSITVANSLYDQSGNVIVPSCVTTSTLGIFTAETNNLNLGSCSSSSSNGQIIFPEGTSSNSVTFDTNPIGFLGASSPGSISACSGSFTNGQISMGCGSSFSATANLPSPSTGWQFSNWIWTGGVSCSSSSVNPTTCTASSSGSLEAVFLAQITFNTSPTSAGSISWDSCSNPGYTNGQTLLSSNFGANTICANTLTNAPFAGWSCTSSISCSGLNPNSTATFNGPGTVTANFGFPPISFDFRLSNSGSSSNLGGVTVAPGSSGSTTITIALVNGPAQIVTLTCSQANGPPLPSGVSCSPASGTPPFTTTLTVTVSSSTPPGYYTIQVIGTAGTLTRSTLFTLNVT